MLQQVCAVANIDTDQFNFADLACPQFERHPDTESAIAVNKYLVICMT